MNHGKTLKVMVPSGKVWEIRETNGEDDGILSTMGTAQTGENICIFLANIIVGPVKVMADDVKKWFFNDIFYLIFKQRIFNQGSEFKFRHQDLNDKPQKREAEYAEDLNLVDGNLADPTFKPGPHQVTLYPHRDEPLIEITTSSKRKFRYKILTWELYDKSTSNPLAGKNRNSVLIDRELEAFEGNAWLSMKTFHTLSSKEMTELRVDVSKNDKLFDPVITFETQFSRTSISLPMLSIPTFFFPEEVM